MDSMPLKQLMKYFVNHLYPKNTSHDIPRLLRARNLLLRGDCAHRRKRLQETLRVVFVKRSVDYSWYKREK